MTINSTTNRIVYTCNGSTTAFAYSNEIFSSSNVVVILKTIASGVETPLALNTDYTVTGAGTGAATITTIATYSNAYQLVIYCDPAIVQTVDLVQNNVINVDTDLERPFDKLTVIAQRLKERSNMAFRLSDGDTSGASTTLPAPVASNFLGWNSSATALTNYTAASIASLVGPILNSSHVFTLKDFGAKGDGVTDDTAAIDSALASGNKFLLATPGTYIVSSSMVIGIQEFWLCGSGRTNTVFKMVGAANQPVIKVSNGFQNIKLTGFTVTRTGTPILGGDGIQWPGVTTWAIIREVTSTHNYNGFYLGTTDYSVVDSCMALYNTNDGFHWDNAESSASFQWQLSNLISAQNGNNGYLFLCTGLPGRTGCSMGTFININSFANTGHGFSAGGTASDPIQGIRLDSCFFGQDGDTEVSLDTYGTTHTITNCFCELAGTYDTGPTLSVPQSDIGHGMLLTANNGTVNINGGLMVANSQYGLVTSAANVSVNGTQFWDSGIAGGDANVSGIWHAAGKLNITGGASGNRASGTYAKYGVYSNDGSKLSAVGLDVSTAATAGLNVTSVPLQAIIVGCRGTNTYIGSGGVMIGAATGGVGAAGTINIAGDISKNGTAYTNP